MTVDIKEFVAPRELGSSMPRDVTLDGAGKALYTVAMAFLAGAVVVGLLLNGVARRQANTRAAFAADGTTTAGEVTRLWRRSDDSWVAYRFEANAGVYQGQAQIRKSRWQALHVGSPIDITYLHSDPNRHALAGLERDGMPGWVPVVASLGIGSIGVLILAAIGRQRRLLANGRAAPAIVTRIRKHSSSHGGSHRAVYYTFPLLSGAMAEGRSDWVRKTAEAGAVLCIVYDPDRPRHNQPYPVPFVRVRK